MKTISYGLWHTGTHTPYAFFQRFYFAFLLLFAAAYTVQAQPCFHTGTIGNATFELHVTTRNGTPYKLQTVRGCDESYTVTVKVRNFTYPHGGPIPEPIKINIRKPVRDIFLEGQENDWVMSAENPPEVAWQYIYPQPEKIGGEEELQTIHLHLYDSYWEGKGMYFTISQGQQEVQFNFNQMNCFVVEADNSLEETIGSPNTDTELTAAIADQKMKTFPGGFQKRILIQGTLHINNPNPSQKTYDISGAYIRMAPGAKIVVEPGMTLSLGNFEPTVIAGCENTYHGIVVKPGAVLTGGNFLMADATTAVTLERSPSGGEGGRFECSGCKFKDNVTDLLLAGQQGDDVLKLKADLYNATFLATGRFKHLNANTYPVQHLQVNNGHLSLSSCSIINASTSAIQANRSTLSINGTKIVNTGKGIYVTNSVLNAIGDDFIKNNQSGISSASSIVNVNGCDFDYNKYGIRSNLVGTGRSSSTYVVKGNYFWGNEFGVSTIWSHLTATGNAFEFDKVCVSYRNSDVYTCNISDNNMTDFTTGISIRSTFGRVPVLVLGNKLETRYFGTGIQLENGAGNETIGKEFRVDGNDILFKTPGGIGIHLRNSSLCYATNNNVTQTGTTDTWGILLEGGGDHKVNCNNLFSIPATTGQWNTIGVNSVNSGSNWIYCTDTDKQITGHQFTGTNSSTIFSVNKMMDHQYGLRLPNMGFMGHQNHEFNQWLGNYQTKAAVNLNVFVNDVEASTFRIDTAHDERPYYPKDATDVTYRVAPNNWFLETANGFAEKMCEPSHCNPSGKPEKDPDGLDVAIADGSIGQGKGQYTEAIRWIGSRQLYERMQRSAHPGFNATPFTQFENAQTAAAGFYQAEQLLRQPATVALPDTWTQQQELNGANWVTQQNSIASGNQQAKTQQEQSLATSLNGLDSYNQDNTALTQSWKTRVNQARALVAAIQDNRSVVQQLRTVQDLYYQTLSGDIEELSQTTRAQLQVLAGQCPLLAGDAVHQARALLSHWGLQWYNDEQLCPGPNGLRQTEAPSTVDFTLMPNPTQQLFTVYLKSAATVSAVRVFNGLGQEVAVFPGAEKTQTLQCQLPALSAGIYYVQVAIEGKGLFTQKLQVQQP